MILFHHNIFYVSIKDGFLILFHLLIHQIIMLLLRYVLLLILILLFTNLQVLLVHFSMYELNIKNLNHIYIFLHNHGKLLVLTIFILLIFFYEFYLLIFYMNLRLILSFLIQIGRASCRERV